MSESFILYTSDYQLIEGLTDEQIGQLSRALFIYARDGEVINLEPVVRMAFAFIKDKIDRNQAKYQKKCERLRANAQKRWGMQKDANDTEACNPIQKNTKEYKRMQLHTNGYLRDSDSDSDSDTSKLVDNNKPSKEGILSASVLADAPDGGKVLKSSNINYAGIKEYWNRKHDETGSAMPRITLMTDNRKVMVKARLRQCKGDERVLYKAIDIAMASDFMNGNNGKGWLAKFDWIFGNEQNFTKVLEGNYGNAEKVQERPASMETGRQAIGERWEQQKHQAQESQVAKDNKFRSVIDAMLNDLKKNPKNKPAYDSLKRFYDNGVLSRLGIDWKP